MNSSTNASIWATFFRKKDPWHETVARLWAETPFFGGIPFSEIKKLAKIMHRRTYQPDEFIFHTGDQGAGAAIILSGQVEIRFGDTLLTSLHKGDFFGEISLVLDERRTADALATEPTELVFFLRPDLDEWISRAPHHGARLSANLAHVLAKRLLHANQMASNKKA